MLTERHELEQILDTVLEKAIEDRDINYRKLEKDIVRYLDEFNILEGIRILERNITLNQLSDQVLYRFTKALYNSIYNTKSNEYIKDSINPKKHYSNLEIEDYERFKRVDRKLGEEITFDKLIPVDNDQWIGVISVQKIAKLYREGRVNYNPNTQRELTVETHKSTEVIKPTSFPGKISEIKNKMLEGNYFSDTVTLNIRKNGEEDFYFQDGVLVIKEGSIDVTDGWNRGLSILQATFDEPKFDMNMEIRITNFTEERAGQFIVQIDKQEKMSKQHTEKLSVEKYEVRVVNKINETYKSDLKGKIAVDDRAIVNKRAYVKFDTMTLAVKENFEIKTSSQAERVGDYLVDFMNLVYDYFYDTFENNTDKNQLAKTEFAFVGYVALASELQRENKWKEKLLNTLKNIDFNDLSTMKRIIPSSGRITKPTIDKIAEYFKSKLK